MPWPHKILEKCINSRLATSCILTGSLMLTTAALAEYKPPADQKPPSSKTTSTVARSGGCQGSSGTTLTAIAPYSHVGQTSSPHPTFAWFVPDAQPYAMEFRLYRYEPSGDTKIQTVNLQSQPGIMSLSLPADQPGLTVGQRYRWQVVILCNPNRPSEALVAEADIEVVELSPILAKELAATNIPIEKANLYAESGLWYDALGKALQATQGTTKDFQLTLLEDLAKVEEQGELAQGSTQSARLRKIIEANASMP